jgi:hypothetical protein
MSVHRLSGKILRRRAKCPRSGFGGFSFAEVMFAVVILGIGFIMVASIFPVALEQTRSNADDNKGNQLAFSCVNIIATTIGADQYPDNGGTLQAFSAQPTLWDRIGNSLVDASDPRYACVPFYYRLPDGSLRITVLAVRRWVHDKYSINDLTSGELAPRGITGVSMIIEPDGRQAVQIAKDTAGMYRSVVDNTFLILASDPNLDGDVIGRTLRVGQQISENSAYVTWSIRPDGGIAPGETFTNATADVVGADWVDPISDASGYTGPSQDIAVYTTFLGHPASSH